jgi:hypothetical protein
MNWLKDDGFSGISWIFIFCFTIATFLISFILKSLINPYSIGISVVPTVMVVGRYFGRGSAKIKGPSIEIEKKD